MFAALRLLLDGILLQCYHQVRSCGRTTGWHGSCHKEPLSISHCLPYSRRPMDLGTQLEISICSTKQSYYRTFHGIMLWRPHSLCHSGQLIQGLYQWNQTTSLSRKRLEESLFSKDPITLSESLWTQWVQNCQQRMGNRDSGRRHLCNSPVVISIGKPLLILCTRGQIYTILCKSLFYYSLKD